MGGAYTIPLSWRNAAMAVLLTAGLWGLPWLLWPTHHQPRKAKPHATPPKVRFVRAAAALDGSAWSPVMFPLPSKVGFSGNVGLKGMGQDLAGVLKRRAEEPPYLARAEEPEPLAVGAVVLSGERTAYSPEPVEPPAYMLVHSNRVEGYRAEWYEGLKARRFEAPALAGLPPPDAGGGWLVLDASVQVDAAGRPVHVFLEQSSGQTNVDAAVIRALRVGRAEPGAGPAAGRARVFCAPRNAGTGATADTTDAKKDE